MRILDTGMVSVEELTDQQKPHHYFNHPAMPPLPSPCTAGTATNATDANKTTFPAF